MIMSREYYLNKIIESLSMMSVYMSEKNRAIRFELTYGIEKFYASLLNMVFNYNLVYPNGRDSNMLSVDLFDYEKRIAIQVTSNGSLQKIRKELDMFSRRNLKERVDRFVILIITEKRSNIRYKNMPNIGIEFIPDRDIWDNVSIILKISSSDYPESQLCKIADFLDKTITANHIDSLVKEPLAIKTLYKYTKMDFLESCIKNGVYASEINAVNDPFESEGIKYPDLYRICCMTNSPKKMLLWAYYTNHRECCIGYDVSFIDSHLLKAVDYVETFSSHENMTLEEVRLSLYNKGKEWAHENEYRAVYYTKEHDAYYWSNEGNAIYLRVPVKSVTFGLFADRDIPRYKAALETIIECNNKSKSIGKKIEVKKCKLKKDMYQIEYDPQFDIEIELENLKKKLRKS